MFAKVEVLPKNCISKIRFKRSRKNTKELCHNLTFFYKRGEMNELENKVLAYF